MAFSEWFSEDFQTAVKQLDGSVWSIIRKRIKKVRENPFLGKPLVGGSRRYSERVLVYRLIYEVVGQEVRFLRLENRDSVYRDFE